MRTTILSFWVFFSIAICNAQFDLFNVEVLNSNYFDVTVNENKEIFICGTGSTIIISSDYGKNWKKIPLKTDTNLLYVNFLSIDSKSNSIISVSNSGHIIYSKDYGKTWEFSNFIAPNRLNVVVLFDNENGMSFGSNGLIIKTSDGGVNWETLDSPTSEDIFSSIILDSKKILFATESGKIFSSDDFGKNWELIFDFKTPITNFTVFNNYIYVSNFNELFKSTDEGMSWGKDGSLNTFHRFIYAKEDKEIFLIGDSVKITRIDINFNKVTKQNLDSLLFPVGPSYLTRMLFLDDNNGVIVGVNNSIFITKDGGKNWELVSFFNNYFHQFKCIHFLNDSVGYVGAYFENIFKTTSGGITWKPIPKYEERNQPVEIKNIHFFDEKTGFALANRSFDNFLKTYDGLNFDVGTVKNLGYNAPNYYYLKDSTFFVYTTVFSVGYPRFFYGFSKFSSNVENTNRIDSISVYNVFFVDNTLYICGQHLDSSFLPEKPDIYFSGFVGYSTDLGETWQRIYFHDVETISYLNFENGKLKYAFGGKYYKNLGVFEKAFKIIDNNEMVEINDSSIVCVYDSIITVHNDKYLFGSMRDKMVISNDNGKTWGGIFKISGISLYGQVTTNNAIYFLSQTNPTNGFIIRYKLKDSLVTVSDEYKLSSAPVNILISNPYPQPSKRYVMVDMFWDKVYTKNDIKIKIYDLFGNLLSNPNIELNNTDTNDAMLKWYIDDVPDGIYFIEVELAGDRKARKVLIYK